MDEYLFYRANVEDLRTASLEDGAEATNMLPQCFSTVGAALIDLTDSEPVHNTKQAIILRGV